MGDPAAAFPHPAGFLATLRVTGGLFRRRLAAIAGPLIVLQLAAALVPLAVAAVVPIPKSLGLAAGLLLFVLLPVLAGSLVAGVVSHLVADEVAGKETLLIEAWRALGPQRSEMLRAGVVAGVLALVFWLLVQNLAVFLLPLFYGPPVLAQVIAIERTPLRPAWLRSRLLLAGSGPRVFLYLLNVALVFGMIAAFAVGAVASGTAFAPDSARMVGLFVFQGLLMGAGVGFLVTMQTVVYLALRAEKEELDAAAFTAERSGLAAQAPSPG